MALVVITGGARCGKSAAAQRLAVDRERAGRKVSVVVFGRDDGTDPEFTARVVRHRSERPATQHTLEVQRSGDLYDMLTSDDVLLMDCLGTLLGLVMEECFSEVSDAELASAPADVLPDGFETLVSESFGSLVEALLCRRGDTIVVTNEVGDGIVPQHASGRLFRDIMGRANKQLVACADGAYLCVCGRMVDLAACESGIHWPND